MTINNQPTQRQDGLFFKQIPVDNSTNNVYTTSMIVGVRNNADPQGNDAVQQSTVKKVVPKTPESFSYDFDGNLLSDGRFNYTWDGENRLIRVESVTSAPSAEKKRVDLQYDSQSRRVSKKVYSWDGTAWTLQDSRRFLNDQFNIVAEINDSGAVINSYAWGTDLSGSMYGAGGVGGLLIVSSGASASSYPSFDGNGNILGYTNASGVVVAELEYSPFGEVIRATGTVPCAYGFSTKYKDAETGLNYYGYRYYSAGLGRWINRDPIGEEGGLNLNAIATNDFIKQIDYLGNVLVYGNFKETPWKANPVTGGSTTSDRINYLIAITQGIVPYIVAGRDAGFNHSLYLSKVGGKHKLDFGRLIEDERESVKPKIRSEIKNLIKHIQKYKSPMPEVYRHASIYENAYNYDVVCTTQNWFWAMGRIKFRILGDYKFDKYGKITLNIKFYWWDPYDFEYSDASAGILKDRDYRRFHDVGLAKEFLIYGFTESITIKGCVNDIKAPSLEELNFQTGGVFEY